MPNKLAISGTCILAILSLTLLFGNGAYAITGNFNPDNEHTCVGLVVFYATDATGVQVPVQVCSGVLISSRFMLTSAHACVSNRVAVVFDTGPITWKHVGNEIQLDGVTKIFYGTAVPNPNFSMGSQGNGAPNVMTHDGAVIQLDEDVPTNMVSKYAQLPQIGIVDSLRTNTAVTLVGYGMQEHLSPRKDGIENTWTGTITRASASSRVISGNFAWSDEFMRCSASSGKGNGGISYGDSGGPVFLGDSYTVLALHSYVTNPNCVGQTYHARLDLSDIQTWLTEVTVE